MVGLIGRISDYEFLRIQVGNGLILEQKYASAVQHVQ